MFCTNRDCPKIKALRRLTNARIKRQYFKVLRSANLNQLPSAAWPLSLVSLEITHPVLPSNGTLLYHSITKGFFICCLIGRVCKLIMLELMAH